VPGRGRGRFTGVRDGERLVALCHVGTNLVPSGSGCGAFAGVDGATRARLVIGEETAVGDFWAAAHHRLPSPPAAVPAGGPAGPARVRARGAAGAGGDGVATRDPRGLRVARPGLRGSA